MGFLVAKVSIRVNAAFGPYIRIMSEDTLAVIHQGIKLTQNFIYYPRMLDMFSRVPF